MASVSPLQVVFYQRDWPRSDWDYQFPELEVADFLLQTEKELKSFGIGVEIVHEKTIIQIKGYGDLLNSIRIRFPKSGHGNMCLGHIIGSSQNRDLVADLRRGINRVVFAPETVEPEGSDKIVCHNCGCGC